MLTDLGLFPLGTVLFPGGVLPLRVFEARYVDLISESMQHDRPFGVCRITRGGEVGAAAEHEPVGCLARITDWDMEKPGVLSLRTRGEQRFRVLRSRIQPDNLIRADVELIDEDPDAPVPPDYASCVELLKRIADDLEQRAGTPETRMIASPYRFDSSTWVSNRLCELLPIAGSAKQKLMELADPLARLSLVHQFLQQRKVL